MVVVVVLKKAEFTWYPEFGFFSKASRAEIAKYPNDPDNIYVCKRDDGNWGYCDKNGIEYRVIWD